MAVINLPLVPQKDHGKTKNHPQDGAADVVHDGVFQVLSTNGDTHLGGDDIDMLLTERILTELGGTPDAEAAP